MWFVLVIILILTVFYKIQKSYDYWKVRGVKHLKPTFLFGNTARSTFGRESIYDQMRTFYEAFPNERYMGIYTFTKPILIIRDLELIKSVLIKDFEHFVDHKDFIQNSPDPNWSKNLVALKGSEWKHMRSILSPSFTSKKMRNNFVFLNETIDTYMNYLNDKNIQQIEIKDFCTRFTNDAIAWVSLGVKCDSINNRNNEFYACARRLSEIGFKEILISAAYTMFPKFCNKISLNVSPKKIRLFIKNIVKETIKIREEKGIVRPDMISLLIEENKQREIMNTEKLSDEEIGAQAFIFLFGGLDTVSNALIFCCYELSRNLKIQEKLQKEIDEYFVENNKLTYEGLMKMKYMDQVVSETLRLWAPALGGDRICTKTYTINPVNPNEQKLTINPGDAIWVPPNGLQMDPKYFSNPNVFDPERFNDENKSKINPYTYMPFGLGPRTCVASRFGLMEVKAFLFSLLKKYTFIATSSKVATVSKTAVNLQLEGEIIVQLKERLY